MNVPHFPQELGNSCLAACVRMVLAFYGTRRSEAELRQLFRTRGMGTSPARVMLELPHIGFQAFILDGTLPLLFDYLAADQPCIVHLWTENLSYWREPGIHAIVVTALTKDHVLVNDPVLDHDQQAIPLDEFLDAWRGADRLLMLVQPL